MVNRRRSRSRGGYSVEDYALLETGFALDYCTIQPGDLEGLAHAWQLLGDRITAEHTSQHPGHRCWAWWLFDAPAAIRNKNPSWGDETLLLHQCGQLSDAELAYLAANGRQPTKVELVEQPGVERIPWKD
jgi:hypothetical protein